MSTLSPQKFPRKSLSSFNVQRRKGKPRHEGLCLVAGRRATADTQGTGQVRTAWPSEGNRPRLVALMQAKAGRAEAAVVGEDGRPRGVVTTPPLASPPALFVAGLLGGVASTLAGHPFDTIKVGTFPDLHFCRRVDIHYPITQL